MKSKILQSLHEDHANQMQLLGFIEAEVKEIESTDEAPNFELLSLALEYCADFPGRFHHPKEDLLYEKLVQRAPEVAGQAVTLTEEHAELSRLTRAFSTAVGDAIEDGSVGKLRLAADQFLRFYRHHIGIEEAEIFPSARRALTDEDWNAINNSYEELSDPLFGEHTRQSYIALQRRILERAAGYRHQTP